MTYRDDNGLHPTTTNLQIGNMPDECGWCSNGQSKVHHYGPCPHVESIEYHPSGAVKCVRFRAMAQNP